MGVREKPESVNLLRYERREMTGRTWWYVMARSVWLLTARCALGGVTFPQAGGDGT